MFDPIDQLIIEHLQGGFPLSDRPFAEVGDWLGVPEMTLISRIRKLLEDKVLTRFGPLYQIERLGGSFMLAAMAVPEDRYEEVAAEVNALSAVAHNYRREHALNMWFVLGTDNPGGIDCAIATIETRTGLPVSRFPKEREYFVGMRFAVGGDAPVGTTEFPSALSAGPVSLDPPLRRLICATQAGLPLVAQPYRLLAESLELSDAQIREGLQYLLEEGAIRRIGVVPNHYAIGYRANGMAVFDVDDSKIDQLGSRVGALDCVSHCYRRPRHMPRWPFNLFTMIHGATRDAVYEQIDTIRSILGSACRDSDVLFSTEILKKTGLRI